MSDAQQPTDPVSQQNNSSSTGGDQPPEKPEKDNSGDTEMATDGAKDGADAEKSKPVEKEPEEEPLPDEIVNASVDEVQARTRLLENDIKVMRSENMRLMHEQTMMREKIKDNADKIKQNKVLPYLVGNVVEVSTSY
jgi:hypothetical protein